VEEKREDSYPIKLRKPGGREEKNIPAGFFLIPHTKKEVSIIR
jgi:hypothetical protein